MYRISIKFVLIILFFSFSINFSQTIDQLKKEEQKTAETEKIPKQFDIDLQPETRTTERMITQPQYYETILDKDIDSTTYILGPGDVIGIYIYGPLQDQIYIEITPEGYLVIPGFTDIKMAGLSLFEGTQLIKQTLNIYFKDTKFSIRLIKMRKFRVYAVGEFKNAGTYYLRGSNKVSDLIEIAEGYSYGADETRIEVRHLSGDVDTIDISKFYRFGMSGENPYLQGGDLVYIPPVDLTGNYVEVQGSIDPAGIYQLRENETLYSLMVRLKLLSRGSDLQNVVIVRDGKSFHFDLLTDLESAQKNILLKSDQIYIAPTQENVYISGEVKTPGIYPYLARYTAKDYAGMAGLTDLSQNVKNVVVIRSNTGKVEKGGHIIVEKGDLVLVPQRQRENLKDILAILTPVLSITLSTIAIVASLQK